MADIDDWDQYVIYIIWQNLLDAILPFIFNIIHCTAIAYLYVWSELERLTFDRYELSTQLTQKVILI